MACISNLGALCSYPDPRTLVDDNKQLSEIFSPDSPVMAFEEEVDPRLTHVAQFLRQNSVALWEPPYWENGQANIPDELVSSAAEECRIPIEMTLALILDLQKHALRRVEDRQLLDEKGVITVKVRIQRKEHNLKIPIKSKVSELYERTAEASEIPRNQIKLIMNGQRLEDNDALLEEKKIRNNSKIIGLRTSSKIEEFIREELDMIESNRKTSKAGSNARTMAALNRCEITNQFGRKVELPDEIRLDLTAALSLHDKGRYEIRRGKPEQALNYLLEAERILLGIDTSSCPILDQLSNLPLLNLDVVWCFLEIGSLNHLSDGDRRLLIAEEGFNKAYGVNMERVTRAKGSSTNEQTLFVRLRLLQGVSAFYKANYAEARRRFGEAESLIAKLRVDEDHLVTLMSFGYTAKECRIALRQTNNSVELALSYLEEKVKLRDEEYQRWKQEQQDKYMKGINRAWFDRMVSDVGISPAAARYALKKTGTDYKSAVDVAMEYECSLNKSKQEMESNSQDGKAEQSEAGPSSEKKPKSTACESDIEALVSMGVDRSCALELLNFFKGSRIDAETFLLTGKCENSAQIDEMLSKMSRFVSHEAEDYLDSTLEREQECLDVYSARLAQIESVVPSAK